MYNQYLKEVCLQHNIADYVLAGVIHSQLIVAIGQAPEQQPKSSYIFDKLDEIFLNFDWNQSFNKPVIIVYDEILYSLCLIEIHNWLRRKSANLANIYVVTSHPINSKRWWNEYCTVMHLESFVVIDTFFSPKFSNKYLQNLSNLDYDLMLSTKLSKIKYLFSYYGGSYGIQERDYLSLQMCEFYNTAMIDYVGTFKDKQQFLAYVEQISYFMDHQCVSELDQRYQQFVSEHGKLITHSHWKDYTHQFQQNETFSLQGLQWEVDQECMATVIRESKQDECFYQGSEKTWRTFYHCNIAIPMGYNSVSDLESQGFWFPHDLIDYSYQVEPIFHKRTEKLKQSLRKLSKHTNAQLKAYVNTNWDNLVHNSKKINELSERLK